MHLASIMFSPSPARGEGFWAANSLTSWLIFTEQNFDPHMLQKCAVLGPSAERLILLAGVGVELRWLMDCASSATQRPSWFIAAAAFTSVLNAAASASSPSRRSIARRAGDRGSGAHH